MRRTRIAITEHARKLTAAHGLSGFTVEELCAQVDISRRTFFNYFASKEAAVIGSRPDVLEHEAMHRFMESGVADGHISTTLLEELIEVMISMLDEVFDVAGTMTHVNAIVTREPTFLDKFIADHDAVNVQLVRLICEREGLSQNDPRPAAAVQLLAAMLHSTVHTCFSQGLTGSIGPRLRETLAVTRELFTPAPSHS